jgi:hypothetical protein
MASAAVCEAIEERGGHDAGAFVEFGSRRWNSKAPPEALNAMVCPTREFRFES